MIAETQRAEFGDFQTPSELANRVVELLASQGLNPRSVVEPTCGLGAFVKPALTKFGEANIVALDINAEYVRKTAAFCQLPSNKKRLRCGVSNFFTEDWPNILGGLAEPILLIGNPPWVTASGLGALGSKNIPQKSNFQNRAGLEALMGKSNFDIAEWILLALLEAGRGRDVTLAMLVKTSVARRVLLHLWRTGGSVEKAGIFRFDAAKHFDVSADACLFQCHLGPHSSVECVVSTLDHPDEVIGKIGWRDGNLVSDPRIYDLNRSFLITPSGTPTLRWRSGVKHDCSGVMELTRLSSGNYLNGLGQEIELEPDYVYPLLKGTDVVHGHVQAVRKWLLVTQQRPSEDTSVIAQRAPKTWEYLSANAPKLDSRRSSIYRRRPQFSVFGVGPYTFAPWKVAISALHKCFSFVVVGPVESRPVVFDDTCYHLWCDFEEDARLLSSILNSRRVQELLGALVFWDAKRPITTEMLQRLDLRRIAADLDLASAFERLGSRARESSSQRDLNFA